MQIQYQGEGGKTITIPELIGCGKKDKFKLGEVILTVIDSSKGIFSCSKEVPYFVRMVVEEVPKSKLHKFLNYKIF